MAGFVIERNGFTRASTLTFQLVQDMIANGFRLVFPETLTSDMVLPARITLEATGSVDPLNETNVVNKQPWRISFQLTEDHQTCFVFIATPTQLKDDGSVAYVIETIIEGGGSSLGPVDVLGAVGAKLGSNTMLAGGRSMGIPNTAAGIAGWLPAITPGNSAKVDDASVGFINRRRRTKEEVGSEADDALIGAAGHSYPMSYRLVITPRGIWVGVWEDVLSADEATYFNWFLVQRPVDRLTGEVITTGKAPVFCVNSVGANIWQFVVRESDTLRPGPRRPADSDTEDSEGIINSENQVGLSEDGKYVVTFPSRLNTSRYRYPHELDMIGTTSADIVSQFSDVPLEVYGEEDARIYKAMHSNKPKGTGMRLLVINSGGGI